MKQSTARVVVYGSDQPCPSCIHSPSSKETYEWLEAAITRKFPNQSVEMVYVDIENPIPDEQEFAQRVIEEDMFYPVVVINHEIVGEGDPRLKTIFNELEKHGYKSE